jgi:hypothetical protein
VPKMGGGGTAVVYPERALRELAAPETPFDSWYSGGMGKLFGFEFAPDSVRAFRVAGGELLFAWREGVPDEREESENS